MNNNTSTELIRQAQREYLRQWRAKNKDKVRKANERYWLKKAQTMLEQQKGGAEINRCYNN